MKRKTPFEPRGPFFDEYTSNVSGPYSNGLWYWYVSLTFDGIPYEREGYQKTAGECWDAIQAYRDEIAA